MTGPAAFLAALPPLPGPPLDVSAEGHRVTSLFAYASGAAAVGLAIVTVALVAFVLAFRARPGRAAAYDHGNGRGARLATLGVALVVFLSVDVVLVRRSRASVDEYLTRFPDTADTVRIEVLAQQWAWNVRYPGADGTFNTPDDVVLLNEMTIPAGRPVFLNLASKDVVHDFFVPAFRIKQDAIPGRVGRLWFTATAPASLEAACSQMCGWAHYLMKADLRVVAAPEFDAWYAAEQERAKRRFDPEDREARWGWEFLK